MKRISNAALLAAAVFAFAFPAISAGAVDRRSEGCKQEIVEACPGITVKTGKLGKCIRAHLGEFSNECREVVQNRLPAICFDEAKSICPGLKVGDGKFAKCMRENINSFSQTCVFGIKSWYIVSNNWRSKAAAACGRDKNKCPGVVGGGGKWWGCLKAHERELSPSCKAFVAAERASN